MVTRRDVRRIAFQALFQLDATGGRVESELVEVIDAASDALEEERKIEIRKRDRRAAEELALGAWAGRAASDAAMLELAPTWPAHRQAAVDRAILRLAHYELTAAVGPPKAAVNEAVELAKAFSTEKSPSFVNGLLDKVLKQVLAAQADAPTEETPSQEASAAEDA